MSIRHTFVSAKSDPADATLVAASHWNASHTNTDAENETPAGSINSTDGSDGNGIFTLASAPASTASIRLFKNGILQLLNTDFTISGTTLTYTTGRFPKTGDWHAIWYRT